MKKSIALIFAVSSLVLAGCCTTHHVTHWEYKTVYEYSYGKYLDDSLNKLAVDGWMIQNIMLVQEDLSQGSRYLILLKKPK
jgi:hypothetical protein